MLSDNEEVATIVVTSVAEMRTIPLFAATSTYTLFEMLNQIIPDRVYMKTEASIPELLSALAQAIGTEIVLPRSTDRDDRGVPPQDNELAGNALQLGGT